MFHFHPEAVDRVHPVTRRGPTNKGIFTDHELKHQRFRGISADLQINRTASSQMAKLVARFTERHNQYHTIKERFRTHKSHQWQAHCAFAEAGYIGNETAGYSTQAT
jgi:hypothetical protein